MLLERALVEPILTKRAKHGSQTPESPDETELTCHDVNDQVEVHFLRESEPRLSFTLDFREWGATSQKIRDETAVCVSCVRLVAGLQCCL